MEIHAKEVITTEITWQSMSQAYSLWSTRLDLLHSLFVCLSLSLSPSVCRAKATVQQVRRAEHLKYPM